MFEALIALTLLSMEPPHGPAGVEWAKNIKTFSSESPAQDNSAKMNRSQLDLKIPAEHILPTDAAHIFDVEKLLDNKGETVVSEASSYPSWTWFKQHQNWISIDKRVLNTRGDNALFQDWSPF